MLRPPSQQARVNFGIFKMPVTNFSLLTQDLGKSIICTIIIMFVAKFVQAQGAPFIADSKTMQYPFVGEVLAGEFHNSIINHSWFMKQGLEPQELYACENVYNEEYDNYDLKIVKKLSLLEYIAIKGSLPASKRLGSAELSVASKAASAVNTEATPFE